MSGDSDLRQFKIPAAGEPVPDDYTRLLDRIDRLAYGLDAQFRLPLTNVRVGWDPIVGIVPVLGDIATAALAFHIITTARRLGADRSRVRRMILNASIDIVIGLVPIAGTVFDAIYRANMRNVELLTDEIRNLRAPHT